MDRVGVEEPEPVSASLAGGPLQHVGLARPAGGKMVVGQDTDPWVTLRELAGDLAGPVGAAVVDHEDLEPGISLAADRGRGNRPAVASSSLAGMIAETSGGSASASDGELGREELRLAEDVPEDEVADRPDGDDDGIDPEQGHLGRASSGRLSGQGHGRSKSLELAAARIGQDSQDAGPPPRRAGSSRAGARSASRKQTQGRGQRADDRGQDVTPVEPRSPG